MAARAFIELAVSINRDQKSISVMVGEVERRHLQAVMWTESQLSRLLRELNLFMEKVQKHYNFHPRPNDFKLPAEGDKNQRGNDKN